MISPLTQAVPILILISFDGFRHDYLHQTTTPNLFDLVPHATIGHMQSLYVTKTFPNHFSIATGLYEDEHEIINNRMYDPRIKTKFQPSTIEKNWWDPYNRTTPIWTANQMYGKGIRNSGSMMYPGSVPEYHGILPRYLKYYDNEKKWVSNVDTVVSWLTDPVNPANFVSMYFDEPDSTSHLHGPFSPVTLNQVRKVDSAAGYLVKRLRDVGLFEQTNFIFLSDHGMAQLNKSIFLDDYVDTKFFDLYGASPTWSVWLKPEYMKVKAIVYKRLKEASKIAHFTIYKRAEIPKEFHYSKSKRIGDYFIMTDEGYDLFYNRTHMGPKGLHWGNHGWDPTTQDMRPLFMAIGPRFKKDYYHEKPFPNIDLFPLMCSILELPIERLPNNGSLQHIVDMLSGPHSNSASQLAKLLLLIMSGFAVLVAGGLLCTLFARYKRPKVKPDPDTSSLSPGLNIDLEFYLDNTSLRFDEQIKTMYRKKNEENQLLLPYTSY